MRRDFRSRGKNIAKRILNQSPQTYEQAYELLEQYFSQMKIKKRDCKGYMSGCQCPYCLLRDEAERILFAHFYGTLAILLNDV